MTLILGVETSCDDTSAAVLDADGRVLSSVVSSQNELHAPFGGVVPELASRSHLELLPSVVHTALEEAGATLRDVRHLAATTGPGLLGSLLVGVSYAKAMSWALGIPLHAVNHVEAHLRSPWLENPGLPYPALALVVSGGHSHLFFCEGPHSDPALVARTRDDAAGEALDKLAKKLRLPYPGGPVMDLLSDRGDPRAVPFTLPKMSSGSLDYSFSGLKTAALHHLKAHGLEAPADAPTDSLPQWEYDLIASYQKRVVDHLLQRVKRAALLLRPASLVMAGGVACNRLLRARLSALAEEMGMASGYPSPRYCTDNAAMVAFRALGTMGTRPKAAPDLDAFPNAYWAVPSHLHSPP